MASLNNTVANLEKNYLFTFVHEQKNQRQNADTIDLGIGDISRPLIKDIAKAIEEAAHGMTTPDGLRGYGPECGYPFLKEAIRRQIPIYSSFSDDEILINDGIISDIAKFPLLFDRHLKIGLQNPCFPPYFENLKFHGLGENIVEIPCTPENHFIPALPKKPIELIYLCSPHNPTGIALDRDQLKQWVNYAKQTHALIVFDAAYSAFIQQENIPRSIYEIEGAKDVAVEFYSFSKSAGFTGLRCGFVICPKSLTVNSQNKQIPLCPFLNHEKAISTNGVSYPIQKAAEKALCPSVQAELHSHIHEYMQATSHLLKGLSSIGYTCYGGVDCPYIWMKTPHQLSSLEFFEKLFSEANIICVPGSGFGTCGEGFVRFSGFTSYQTAEKVMERLYRMRHLCDS